MRLRSTSLILAAAVTAGAATLVTGGTAQAAEPGYYLYEAQTGDCIGSLFFHRASDGNNTAQGEIDAYIGVPSYDACVGALYRSNDGGATWSQVSGTHWVWGSSDGTQSASTTYWYNDGAAYLARTCVHEYYGHTGGYSATVCTSAH